MTDFAQNGYGIAGTKNTTPNYPPPVRTSTIPSIAQQMQERRLKYGSVNVGGSYISPSGSGYIANIGATGTPLRSTRRDTGAITYFGGTPTSQTGYMEKPVYTGGTPTSPVGYVAPPAPPPGELVYFGGTPTNPEGYVSMPTYFGGTPTSNVGYKPPPLTPENDPSRFDEERRRREEEDAKKKAAEDARLAEIEKLLSQLGALQPEQQMAYRQAVRDAEREFEMMRNQIQAARRGVRRDFRQDVRAVNRDQSGQATDLAEALAFLGMDTSPATMGVGLQDVEMQADIARAELARVKAASMGQLDTQMTQARIGRRRALSAAEQAKLQAQAQQRREQLKTRLESFL